jgi:hypothetical protein
MRAGEPYKLSRPLSRAARCVLTLGLVPVLVLRPAYGGAVILHDHVSHEFHAHTISPSQLEDWRDEHHQWHERVQADRHDSLEMLTPHDHTTDISFKDDSYGAVVIVHYPLLVRQSSRLVLALERCSVAPGFGMFFGIPPGQSLEQQCLLDDTPRPVPAGLSATTALLLRSHALLI